jgi:hypothetical protein
MYEILSKQNSDFQAFSHFEDILGCDLADFDSYVFIHNSYQYILRGIVRGLSWSFFQKYLCFDIFY